MEEKEKTEKNWYDKNYKLLLIIPIFLLAVSIIYLIGFYQKNGDIILKDVSLTGGTSITVFDEKADIDKVKDGLKEEFPDIRFRSISDFRTGKQHGFSIETQKEALILKSSLEKVLGYNLTDKNSSIEFSGSSLSSGFYQQLRNSIVVAFLLMGLVVFIIFGTSKKLKIISTMLSAVIVSILFKSATFLSYGSVVVFTISFLWYLFSGMYKGSKYGYLPLLTIALTGILFLQKNLILKIFPSINDILIVGPIIAIILWIYIDNSIPSVAVILAAFADIVMTLAIVDFMGVQISAAGIIAFLMLIGYSVDTDILLTTRLLRNKEGTINERILGALKTGITMTITAIAAVGASLIFIYSFSETLRQIFGIIIIGLVFDIINTWITNASILKWYMEVKNIQ